MVKTTKCFLQCTIKKWKVWKEIITTAFPICNQDNEPFGGRSVMFHDAMNNYSLNPVCNHSNHCVVVATTNLCFERAS